MSESLFHPDAIIHIKSADNPTGPLVFNNTPFKTTQEAVVVKTDPVHMTMAHGILSVTQEYEANSVQPASNDYDDRPKHFQVWDLPEDLGLVELAANFYLLYNLNHHGIDDGEFEKFVNANVGYLYRYSDMVIGGELRHAPGNVDKHRVSTLARPLWEKIRSSYYDIPVDGHYGYNFCNGRHDAWLAWHAYRTEVGTPALRQAMSVFSSFGASNGRSSFGGAKWANIAKIVWNYERGKMSAAVFMDYVWGLEHNYGSFFNKIVWGYAGLKDVLNANLSSDYLIVYTHASLHIQRLYKEKLRCH